MNIIITGALGHIGSYLLHDLPKKFNNLNIYAIDSLFTQRYFSVFNLPHNCNFKFIEADVIDFDFETISNIDLIIHLAAITDATSSFSNRALVEQNNFETTDKIAKYCSYKNINLITMSSASVYGTQKKEVDENCSDEDLKPQSPYAEVKLREENVIRNYAKKNNFKFSILRLGTIFGFSPGMRFHTAVNKFCWQSCTGMPLTVWETAMDQKRPYLDLIDLSNAIEHIIKNDIFENQIYNLLTQNYTVREIISVIEEEVSHLEVQMVNSEIMNQLSYEVSCKKFIETGFLFEGDIKRGIKETINSLSQLNSIKHS